MKKLKVAIIGQGRSGRDIHGAYFKSEANKLFEVVAVVDEIPLRRQRAKEEYGCDVYEKVSDLYGRKDIDLVVNATFSHMHSDVSIGLMEHGFNVVCEKPFARSYEEGCKLIQIAKENGVMINGFQNSRFAPYYVTMKEFIDSGKLGDIKQITLNFSKFARRWDWQTLKSFAGGEVRNTAPHPLDQALDLMGFPDDITVFSKLDRATTFGDAEDYVKIILTSPGKPLVDIEISTCNCYSPYLFLVQGSKGTLRGTIPHIDVKYFDPENEPVREVVAGPLSDENGYPVYCSENLKFTEASYELGGNPLDVGADRYYKMIYDYLTEGKEMEVDPQKHILLQLKVIDEIYSQNCDKQ